jgi:hypothetical protein
MMEVDDKLEVVVRCPITYWDAYESTRHILVLREVLCQ